MRNGFPVQGVDQMANNGSLQNIANAAARGEDVDDLMFDAALDAALETGNGAVLPAVYGTWSLAKKKQ